MTPQVREITQAPIAAPLPPVTTALSHAITAPQIAAPNVEIIAPTSAETGEPGHSILDKRRRRRARLSHRH